MKAVLDVLYALAYLAAFLVALYAALHGQPGIVTLTIGVMILDQLFEIRKRL